MLTCDSLTRRTLLRSGPALLPAVAAPSDRITMGVIGLGPRGRYVLGHFLAQKDVRVVAVADCFADRRAAGKDLVDRHYGDNGCAAYRLHERILERSDIDAVLIATGDRWHAVLSVLAASAGKHVYSEKPFTLTVAEGRALVREMERLGKVWQCGTQRRSNPAYKLVVDVVRSGRIGRLRAMTASLGSEGWRANGVPTAEPTPDPDVFDYDRWLGQAPWAPYSKLRVALWRLNWDTSAGVIADMGPHYFDFAQWAHGSDLSGPVEFDGNACFHESGFNNTPWFFHVRARYADGVLLLVDTGPKAVRFDGDRGWIQLADEGAILADPKPVLAGLDVPNGDWKIMTPHIRDFLECVRTGRRTASYPELAQRGHTIAHCANICLRLGRKLRWDPASEHFPEDEEANRLLARPMRAPWRI